MNMVSFRLALIVPALALAGCASLLPAPSDPARDQVVHTPDDTTLRPEARPQDGTEENGAQQDRAAAETTASAGSATALGSTIASLGSPSEAGLWLRTPLVRTVQTGRIRLEGGTTDVRVELRPLDAEAGAGSRMSLAAFQALGLAPTALPRLTVLAD